MASDRWRQVRDLFEQTLELDDEEQQALLRERCGSDVALRREVEAWGRPEELAEHQARRPR